MFLSNKQKLAFILSIIFILNISKLEIANVAPERVRGDIKYLESDKVNKENDTKKLNKKPQRF